MDFLCRVPKKWHQSARIKAAFRNQILNIGNFCIITALSTTTTRASERSSLSSKFFYCNSSDELAFEANHDKASKWLDDDEVEVDRVREWAEVGGVPHGRNILNEWRRDSERNLISNIPSYFDNSLQITFRIMPSSMWIRKITSFITTMIQHPSIAWNL